MTQEDPGANPGIQPLGHQGLATDPESVGDVGVASEAQTSKRPWMKIAAVVGGAVVAAGGAVVATLAATHKTAVFENAKAYANGINDALEAVRNGFDPFDS